jgi:hypothetical protein
MSLKEAWKTLENDSVGSTDPLYKKLKCASKSLNLFISVQPDEGKRSIFIGITQDEEKILKQIPEIKGIELAFFDKKIGSSKVERFLSFIEGSKASRSIAEIVFGEVLVRIKKLNNRDNLSETLTKIMREWQAFFSVKKSVLSEHKEQGLVGELMWIHELLRLNVDPFNVLNNWCGPDFSRHDFEFPDNHIEVKTTSRKDGRITISSQHQLDDSGLKNLFLVVYSYNKIKSSTASLPEFYQSIYNRISTEQDLVILFESGCLKSGYDHNMKEKYDNRFVGDYKIFKVIDGFPRIIIQRGSSAIGDLTYSVDVSACDRFSEVVHKITAEL